MTWTVELTDHARRQLKRLDQQVRQRILRFLRKRIATAEDPRRLGHALQGRYAGLWRYRVGDYRVVCQFEDDRLVVLVVGLGHRSKVYN